MTVNVFPKYGPMRIIGYKFQSIFPLNMVWCEWNLDIHFGINDIEVQFDDWKNSCIYSLAYCNLTGWQFHFKFFPKYGLMLMKLWQ